MLRRGLKVERLDRLGWLLPYDTTSPWLSGALGCSIGDDVCAAVLAVGAFGADSAAPAITISFSGARDGLKVGAAVLFQYFDGNASVLSAVPTERKRW